LRLSGPGEWENTLKELHKDDVRVLSAHQDEDVMALKDGPREGYRKVSWIYTAPSATDTHSPEFIEGGVWSRSLAAIRLADSCRLQVSKLNMQKLELARNGGRRKYFSFRKK
jgi:hypothetical protein